MAAHGFHVFHFARFALEGSKLFLRKAWKTFNNLLDFTERVCSQACNSFWYKGFRKPLVPSQKGVQKLLLEYYTL
jgi:hypothetical protein